jgi:hypothetical protein
MNPPTYFTTLESDAARADEFEGVATMIRPEHVGRFTIDTGIPSISKITVSPSDLAAEVKIRTKERHPAIYFVCSPLRSRSVERSLTVETASSVVGS